MSAPDFHPSSAATDLRGTGRASPPESSQVSRPVPHLGWFSGALVVAANMVGIGVFTTAGYMLGALGSPPAVLLAWMVGGVAALCGALCYAELGAALPRNGGEFQLLSRIYHPLVGLTAGWTALVVGFAAPLAFYAHVFGTYLHGLWPRCPALAGGLLLLAFVTLQRSLHVAQGTLWHNTLTIVRLMLVGGLALAGLLWGDPSRLWPANSPALSQSVWQSAFAVQLVYVSFAYSGWNASAYLLAEFHQPQRDMPRAVLLGTGLVMLLYVGLNAGFLMAAPAGFLTNQEDVAKRATEALFGPGAARGVAALIALGLVTTASSNLLAGSRVSQSIGSLYPPLRCLDWQSGARSPLLAILLQSTMALLLLVTATFDGLMSYIGLTLSLSAMATVAGLFVLRRHAPNLSRPYRCWGYPLTPLIFLALEGWMVVHTLKEKPVAAYWSLATIAIGLGVALVVWTAAGRPHDRAADPPPPPDSAPPVTH